MNVMLGQVVRLYEAYLDEFHQLEQNRKPMEGAFGMGTGPKDYPCHEKFAQDLDRLLEDLTAQAITSEQAGNLLRYIYCTAPVLWESETSVYWMLLAVHGSTQGLIKQLDVPIAKALCKEYQHLYPRYKRLPVQENIFTALQRKCRTV